MLLPSSDLQKELLKFFGIGRMTAPRVLARLSIPRLAKVEDLSEAHVAALTAYLSSTTISDLPPRTPVIDPLGERELLEGETAAELNDKQRGAADWGRQLLVENELRGKMNADIRTLIDIGTWRGRRCVCRLLQSLCSPDPGADPASCSCHALPPIGTGSASRSRLAPSTMPRRRFGSTSPSGTFRCASARRAPGLRGTY
jgi:ribosomal protein S13